MTSAQHGEDGVLLQRAVTRRAVEMATSAAISTGVGASSHAPAQQERLAFWPVPPPVPRPSPQGTPEGPTLAHPARHGQTALRLAPGRSGGAAAAGGGGRRGRRRWGGAKRAFEFPIRRSASIHSPCSPVLWAWH